MARLHRLIETVWHATDGGHELTLTTIGENVISPEVASAWFSEAQNDPRLKTVIEEIAAKYTICIERTDDPEWSSSVEGTTAVITISDTQRHLSAFAHELLHLRLSTRGYRHILGCAHPDGSKRNIVSYVLQALDNELQHHRMFPDFVAAGFDGAEFYAESDDQAHVQTEDEINGLTKATSAPIAVLSYLTLLGPGGNWPDGARESLTDKLQQKVSSDVWTRLLAVRDAIVSWSQSADLDPTNTIATILESLGGLEGAYICEAQSDYPDRGAFIPRSMTQAQFEKLIAG